MSDLVAGVAGDRSFCTFRVDDRLYGVDVASVREVSTHVALTPVPQAPPIVRGLVNLRSRLYLVLDLRPALGLPPVARTADSRLIVLHPRVAENLGLFVERGGDIVRVAWNQIEELAQPAADGPAAPATPVVGVCKLAAELLMIVDPAKLVGAVEREIG
jgi:purine-binding chemotaxis protein CheW